MKKETSVSQWRSVLVEFVPFTFICANITVIDPCLGIELMADSRLDTQAFSSGYNTDSFSSSATNKHVPLGNGWNPLSKADDAALHEIRKTCIFLE